jgi:hypothetical protein
MKFVEALLSRLKLSIPLPPSPGDTDAPLARTFWNHLVEYPCGWTR